MNLANEVASLQVDLETIPPVPECLHQRVAELGADPAPQLQMVWNPSKWIKWLGYLPHVTQYLEDLAERTTQKYGEPAVSRTDVLNEVKPQVAADNVHLAFIAVMIWGYGTTGYGAHRTNEILQQSADDQSGQLSEHAIQSLKSAAAYAANGTEGTYSFYILHNSPTKLKGLGPAFFTKWLSFASMHNVPDEASALPVLDDVVAEWIKSHTATPNGSGLDLDPQKDPATRKYHQYLQLLDAWSKQLPHPYTRTQIERTIFTARSWDKDCPALKESK